MYKFLLVITLILFSNQLIAEPITIEERYEKRYQSLLNELRCLVCQNQTIAESEAGLAIDLKLEVKKMLQEGASDEDIIDFMVNRYGDFVLYKPLIKPKTYLLWFGPFIALALVLVGLLMVIRKQKKVDKVPLTDNEEEKLKSILDKTKK